jgi:hypothetical protein
MKYRPYISSTYVKGAVGHSHSNGIEQWKCYEQHGKSQFLKNLQFIGALALWTVTLVVVTF